MTILRSCSEMLLAAEDRCYDKILGVTRSVYQSGRTKPLKFRENALRGLLQLLKDSAEELMDAAKKDLGKSQLETEFCELGLLKNDIIDMLKNLRKFAADENLPLNILASLDKGFVRREPLGVVLIVGSWNYPFTVTLKPLIGAIAAGNCAVIKPSEVSAECAKVMAKLLPHYIDPECYPVIVADGDGTKKLLKSKFDYIFYTGSSAVGALIYQAAALHLTPVTLELGGKSPCYIDDNADVMRTTKRILWGKITNVGQTCIAPDYILCSEKVQREFADAARTILRKWYGDISLQKCGELARIINKGHWNRLKNLLDTTRGTIALGGGSDEDDLWIEPTIVVNVKSDDPLMQDEIFGPILPAVTVNSADEAIRFILSKPKPLAFYVFSNTTSVADKMLSNVSSGGACVNDVLMQYAWKGLPFGGVGNSGMGRYHGKFSFDTFSHQRGVLVRSGNALSELYNEPRYPPLSSKKVKMLQFASRHFDKFNVNLSFLGLLSNFLSFCLGILVLYAVTTLRN